MTTRVGPLRAKLWALLLIMFATTLAGATSFKKQATIVDLLSQSELIIQGRVKSVTDGIDARGIPYTEVTVQIIETIKGQARGEYTFRQFGLLKPRKMPDGRMNLLVTPAAWSTYTKGEETVLFLYKTASWTGLKTTTALGQGKFNVNMGNAANQINNAGLFEGVQIDSSLLGDTEKRVMGTRKGPMNAQGFVSLVKQAVNGKWVEKGKMKNAKK